MRIKSPMPGSFHLFVSGSWVTHVGLSIHLCGIEAGLSFEGSAKELQADLAQNDHLMCGPSPCRSPTDAPEKVQHRRSGGTRHSGYVRHHLTRRPGV